MFIIYVIDLSTKNKMLKTGFHIFTKIKNTDRLKLKKNTCFSYFISENPVFFFFQKMFNISWEHSFNRPLYFGQKSPADFLTNKLHCWFWILKMPQSKQFYSPYPTETQPAKMFPILVLRCLIKYCHLLSMAISGEF